MRKVLLGFAVVLVLLVGLYFRFHHATPPLEIAYAGNRTVTVWSTSAQVREPLTTVTFGQRLEVLQRFQDQVKIRAPDGTMGWIQERDLLSADLWQTLQDLEAKAAGMPVEAQGHTKNISNLHIEPGRDAPRVRQLSKDVPIELLTRQPALIVTATSEANGEAEPAAAAPEEKKTESKSTAKTKSKLGSKSESKTEPRTEPKSEDWWLVRAHTADQGTLAGWLLGRFVDLDVPSPLPDYASSAGMRIVAWTELNRVDSSEGKPVPQYLLLGTHGPEGQACDFTSLRVYTWGKQKARYETAFVESNVCGKLPIQKSRAAGAAGDVTFSFQELGAGAPQKRTYQMHQTVVRRVGDGTTQTPRKHRR
jgi:hypothetical protein